MLHISISFQKQLRNITNVNRTTFDQVSLSSSFCYISIVKKITRRRLDFAKKNHHSDVIMGAMAPQITGISIVYSTACSVTDQRKHQSYAREENSPATCEFPAQRPVTRKMFPFDDVIRSFREHNFGYSMHYIFKCMSGSLTRDIGENVPGIPGACATPNLMYLVRGPYLRDHDGVRPGKCFHSYWPVVMEIHDSPVGFPIPNKWPVI